MVHDPWSMFFGNGPWIMEHYKFEIKKRGMAALSDDRHPIETGQRGRTTLDLDRFRECERKRMFRREPDFLSLRCQHCAGTGTTAYAGADSGTLATTSDRTNCSTEACSTCDDSGITLLRRLGDLHVGFRRNCDRLTFNS